MEAIGLLIEFAGNFAEALVASWAVLPFNFGYQSRETVLPPATSTEERVDRVEQDGVVVE